MAAATGNAGSISAGTNILLLTHSWSFDWKRAIHEAGTFAGGEWDVTLPGIQELSGTAEGWLDDTVPVVLDGATGFSKDGLTFVLTSSAGKTYTFVGNFTSFAPSSETDTVTRWTAAFESSGGITVA